MLIRIFHTFLKKKKKREKKANTVIDNCYKDLIGLWVV